MSVESPCISICVLDNSGKYCIGCYRTADEIEKWSNLSEQERRHLTELLGERRNDLNSFEF